MGYQIIALVMIVDALVFGVIAFVLFRKAAGRVAASDRVMGEVFKVERDEREGVVPSIRYTAASGQTVTVDKVTASIPQSVRVGDKVPLLVDRADPQKLRGASFLGLWFLPMAFGMMAVSSLLGAAVVFVLLKH